MTDERRAEIKKILETDETALFFRGLEKVGRLTWGQQYAYRAWRDSLENESSTFEVRELPWGQKVKEEMPIFVATLQDAGIDHFIVTDQSTSLMESLHALVAAGGSIEGTATVTRKPPYWDEETRLGLEIRIA